MLLELAFGGADAALASLHGGRVQEAAAEFLEAEAVAVGGPGALLEESLDAAGGGVFAKRIVDGLDVVLGRRENGTVVPLVSGLLDLGPVQIIRRS